jgi:hypothetical protein
MKGSKLLSDYFIGLKLPLHEKKQQLILTDNRNIAWIIDKRTSQYFAVSTKVEKILKISVSEV